MSSKTSSFFAGELLSKRWACKNPPHLPTPPLHMLPFKYALYAILKFQKIWDLGHLLIQNSELIRTMYLLSNKKESE